MEKKKVDFLIRYEHKLRELESIMLIRTELERRGYSVAFSGNYDYKRDYTFSPKVLVCPSLYATEQLAGNLIEYGIQKKVANLVWEQVFKAKVEEDPNSTCNITGISARAVSFCWGQKSIDRIVGAGVAPDRAVLSGHINTDLLRGKFRKTLISKEELAQKYNLDANKRWNLFISSFVCCEMSDHQHQMLNDSWGIEETTYFTEVSNESRKEIIEWFKKVLVRYPEDIIIYRPHPVEASKSVELKKLAKEFANFRIISDEAIKHWIDASDKIYNWYSTGMIDVVVLNKPVRLLRPIKIRNSQDYYIFANAEQITTTAEFLADYEDLELREIMDRELFGKYYYLPEGFVYQKICDVLEEMYHTDKYDMYYTFGERLKYTYLHLRWRILYPFRFLKPYLKHIPGYKKRLEGQLETLDLLKTGYEKNVATDDDIKEIYSRVRPIIYGE